ncbi:beta-glucosidase 22-like [Panicum miliaceum]|uniref:Beta-glucosidase 22-like n=1 Tax=Panicum miliaceum TaxID=4540 RepID=A0A3L6SVU0_PANMI|nr:beta-glucosidase 22-like [Panicum miliaceum]
MPAKRPGLTGDLRDMAAPTQTCRRVFILLSLQLILVAPWQGETSARALNFTRQDFPPDFVFGAGTSAYQYEGATNEDGRSPSIWDTFTHQGKMPDKSTGDLGADGYRKYKEDVKLMSDTGLEAYRFSISWSRLIPRGRGPINPKGLEYYNNLINELVKLGIEIHVTLYQLDFPQILEDEYQGWLSPRVVEDFTAYADACFREFGDRVRHWTTMDEPAVAAIGGYDSGTFAPGRCSKPFGGDDGCPAGNSTVEPYVAVHNSILAHASAVKLYRDKYKATQQGVVGMNVYTYWCYRFSPSPADTAAAQRTLDFMIGWTLDPLVYGDYPKTMKEKVGSRLPLFTEEQSAMICGATDFISVNHYTSVYISDRSDGAGTGRPHDVYDDMSVTFRSTRDGTPTPTGLQCLLEYLSDTYKNIPVYVQENGLAQDSKESIYDQKRVDFLTGYIGSTLGALRNGANVKGYFVWSFLDLYEFLAGYGLRYGFYHVDFQDAELPRKPKLSAQWYSKFLRSDVGMNPLQLRVHLGFEYQGIKDPSRMAKDVPSNEDIMRRVSRLFTGVHSEPYISRLFSSDNPPNPADLERLRSEPPVLAVEELAEDPPAENAAEDAAASPTHAQRVATRKRRAAAVVETSTSRQTPGANEDPEPLRQRVVEDTGERSSASVQSPPATTKPASTSPKIKIAPRGLAVPKVLPLRKASRKKETPGLAGSGSAQAGASVSSLPMEPVAASTATPPVVEDAPRASRGKDPDCPGAAPGTQAPGTTSEPATEEVTQTVQATDTTTGHDIDPRIQGPTCMSEMVA